MIRAFFFFVLFTVCTPVAFAQETEQTSEILEGLRLTEFAVNLTSGTQILERLEADTALVAPDGISLLLTNVRMTVTDEERVVRIDSPLARYYFGGRAVDEPREIALPPTRAMRRDFEGMIIPGSGNFPMLTSPRRGDLLLVDPDNARPVRIDVEGQGNMEAENLVWREAYQRFISVGDVRQIEREHGIDATTQLFIVDRAFEFPFWTSSNVNLTQ